MKNKKRKIFEILLALLLCIGINISASAQFQRKVTGRVTDTKGEILVGVNVYIKGTTIGKVTNAEGFYEINIPSEDAILMFSYIGNKTVERPVKGISVVNVTMEEDAQCYPRLYILDI